MIADPARHGPHPQPTITNPLSQPDATIDALFLRALRKARPDRFALRALFKAQEFLSLALGHRLGQLRTSDEPLQAAFAQAHAREVLVHLLRQAVDLLGERLDKIPERRRPHYTVSLRQDCVTGGAGNSYAERGGVDALNATRP
jgi:hypothetical protein